METREEKLAKWADPSLDRLQSLRFLRGSLCLAHNGPDTGARISDVEITFDDIQQHLLNSNDDPVEDDDSIQDTWHFKVISLPRLRPGRLALSTPKKVFQQIQDSWNLHPRTVEVFLSNNGVLTSFHCAKSGRTSLLLKVANSSSTGFDCVSVTFDPPRRTTFVLYHHLQDQTSVFATLLSTPEQCIDPHFFVATLYRSHHQHIETHRNTIDDAILRIERQTGFGHPGRLIGSEGRAVLDDYPVLTDPKTIIQQLSYCQTDLAIIGHVARCCLDCGEWLIQAIDETLQSGQSSQYGREQNNSGDLQQRDRQSSDSLTAVRMATRQDVEYMRRRTVMLLSQVQQMRDRAQSQTSFILNTITQSDAEYTAAIAVDGKRDSIAMKTISVLGIVFLPGTFVATLFSMGMFNWGTASNNSSTGGGGGGNLTVSSSMWIYWAVTVPLTAVTFVAWVLWSRREERKSGQRLGVYRTKTTGESEKGGAGKVGSFVGDSEKMV